MYINLILTKKQRKNVMQGTCSTFTDDLTNWKDVLYDLLQINLQL